jgi:hypothetical protein
MKRTRAVAASSTDNNNNKNKANLTLREITPQ